MTLKTVPCAAYVTHADGRDSLAVLLVDDVQQFREMYSAYLSYQGVGVTTALDGWEALEIARHYPPDAIVLDLAMPGMDGREFLMQARRDKRLARIPVVVVSAYGNRENVDDILALGADSFVDKPCVPSQLLSEIRRVSTRRRLRPRP
jgi:CheY-like chemotaxis protein